MSIFHKTYLGNSSKPADLGNSLKLACWLPANLLASLFTDEFNTYALQDNGRYLILKLSVLQILLDFLQF